MNWADLIMKDSIKSISFIGSGNVATHLALALQSKGCSILEVFSPNAEHAQKFAKRFSCKQLKQVADLNIVVDLLIITIPDAKVESVANQLPKVRGIVAHTSGITEMDSLQACRNYGVLYPLQTFTRDREMDILDTPFCIEGATEVVGVKLFKLAQEISSRVQYINSEERKKLHLAAVFVSNFSNHLYSVSHDFLQSQELDFTLLLPLIRETAAKVQDILPADAQTGPARRNDQLTIKMHLEMLDNSPFNANLYRLFSEQIKNKFHE